MKLTANLCIATLLLLGCVQRSHAQELVKRAKVRVTASLNKCDDTGCPFVLHFTSLEKKAVRVFRDDFTWACGGCTGSLSLKPLRPGCGSGFERNMTRPNFHPGYEDMVLKPGETYSTREYDLNNPGFDFPELREMVKCGPVEMKWSFDSVGIGHRQFARPRFGGTILLKQAR